MTGLAGLTLAPVRDSDSVMQETLVPRVEEFVTLVPGVQETVAGQAATGRPTAATEVQELGSVSACAHVLALAMPKGPFLAEEATRVVGLAPPGVAHNALGAELAAPGRAKALSRVDGPPPVTPMKIVSPRCSFAEVLTGT